MANTARHAGISNLRLAGFRPDYRAQEAAEVVRLSPGSGILGKVAVPIAGPTWQAGWWRLSGFLQAVGG